MTDELLPCPFCASRNVSNSEGTRNGEPFPYVECESCGATSEPDFWNRRAFPAPTQPVRPAPEAAAEPVAWEVLTLGEWRQTRFPDELRAKGFEVRIALPDRERAASLVASEDTRRLDYLQQTGSTVELVPGGHGGLFFRIGGLYRAVHADIRQAIDAARGSAGEAQS